MRWTRVIPRPLRPVHLATLESVASGLAGQASLLFSGIVSARVLGVQDRGHLALLGLFPVVLVQMGGVGLPLAATYYIARDRSRAATIARRLRRVALVQIAALIAIHVALLLAVIGRSDQRVMIAGAISILALPAILIQQYGLAVLQGQGRFRIFNVLRLLPSVLFALGVIVAAIVGQGHLQVLTGAWVASFAFPAAWTFICAHRTLSDASETEAPPLRDMLRFGLKGLLGSASPLETFRPDQAAIGLFLTPASLGLYVVGVAFTNLPRFVAQSIGMIAYPSVAERDPEHARRAMWRFVSLAVASSAGIVAVTELAVGWLLPRLFGEEFQPAVATARILLLGAFCFSVRRVLADGARGAGRPGAGTVGEIASWISLIPLLVVLVPHGLTGVAWALTASAGISLAVLIAVVVLGRQRPTRGTVQRHP